MPPSKNREPHWPARWTRKRGRLIYYVVPAADRERWDGKSWFRLGATEAEAWITWYARTEGGDALTTVADAIDRYTREVLPKLAASTQRQYTAALGRLRIVFGGMLPKHIEPRHVYGYRDRRPDVAGNRDVAVLSALLQRCVQWGMVNTNVCREVTRATERPRNRYVEDAEVAAFCAVASPLLRAYVVLKLLTGLRQGELLGLRVSDWDGERLRVQRSKGGRPSVYTGPGLAEAVQALLDLRPRDVGWLICTRTGDQYTGDGFRSIWARAMRKLPADARWREHDLRAKTASDATAEHATELLGHQDAGITRRVYRRKPAEVTVLPLGTSHKS